MKRRFNLRFLTLSLMSALPLLGNTLYADNAIPLTLSPATITASRLVPEEPLKYHCGDKKENMFNFTLNEGRFSGVTLGLNKKFCSLTCKKYEPVHKYFNVSCTPEDGEDCKGTTHVDIGNSFGQYTAFQFKKGSKKSIKKECKEIVPQGTGD